MSVLSVLSGLASAGGDFARGYAHDEEGRVKDALAQAKAAQDAERNHVLNLLTQRQIATPILGEEGYTKGHADVAGAEANAKVPAAVSEARALAPIKVQQAVDTASGTAPIEVKKAADIATATMPIDVEKSVRTAKGIAPIQQQTHATNKLFDDAHPSPQFSIQNPEQPGEPARGVVLSGDPAHPKASTVEIPGVSKTSPTAGGVRGFGQGGPIGAASAVGSFKSMERANPNLQKFEIGLLSEAPGSPTLKLFDTYRQNILNAAQHAAGGGHGAIASAIQNATSTGAAEEMARQNPQLALYARNLKQWIVDDLNLTRNASDERGRMDALASSVLAVPLSDMPMGERIRYVHQVVEARNARLEGIKQAIPGIEGMLDNLAHRGGHAPTPGTAASPADPEFDALLAKYKKP